MPASLWQLDRDRLLGVFFLPDSFFICNNKNAAERPRPADHRLEKILLRVPDAILAE